MATAALLPALFLLVITALAERAPTITYISQEQIKDIGDTVELECSVKYAQEYPVLWIKVDHDRLTDPLPISSGTSLIIRDNRFALRYDTASSTYSLLITDVRDEDHGSYLCQITINENARITAEAKLLVRSPPVFLANSTDTVTAAEGDSVQLRCYVKGYPPPQISWRKESNVVYEDKSISNNVFDLKNITRNDRGFYYCVADNGVGRRKKHSIEVNVKFAPIVSVPRPRVGQALNYHADLECNVESYPAPAIYWLRNETILHSSAKYTTSSFSTADAYVSSVFRILRVEPADYGIYTCNAANELGSSHGSVEFFETDIPVCPPACSVLPITTIDGSKINVTSDKEHQH